MTAAPHQRIAQLAFETRLPLEEVCATLGSTMSLPKFELDHENESEWGECELAGVTYNVACGDKPGYLRALGWQVPATCNVGVTVMLDSSDARLSDVEAIERRLVDPVRTAISTAFRTEVYRHRF